MQNQSSLFSLIKSLSRSEKRYFKIFSKRHILGSQNKYILLFDILTKQVKEDDEKVISALSQKGYDTRYLSADKNYLYNLLLRSMNDYYYGHNISLTIKNNLQTIEVLFHKGLYKDCLKIIAQTEKLIKQSENYQLMPDLIMWKRKCTGYAYGLAKAQEVNLEMDVHFEKIKHLKVIIDMYYTTYSERLREEVYSKEELNKLFGNIISDPLLQSEDNLLTTQSKVFHHLCYVHYYYLNNEFDEEYRHHKRIIQLIQQTPNYQKENAMDCIALYNRMLAQSKYLSSDIFYRDLEGLRNFDVSGSFNSMVIRQRIFIHTSTNELEHLFIHHQYLEANKKAADIENGMAQYSYPIEPYHTIHLTYLFAMISISVADYKKALGFTNKIINEFNAKDNNKSFLRAQILNIIVHFELKNYKIVENLSGAFIKKYKNESTIDRFEFQLLKVLYKCCRFGNKPIQHVIATHFQELIETNKNDIPSSIQNRQTKEHYVRWLHANMKQSSIQELYQ